MERCAWRAQCCGPTEDGQHKDRREPPSRRELSRKTGRLSWALRGKEASDGQGL